jgi:hypothetical protein
MLHDRFAGFAGMFCRLYRILLYEGLFYDFHDNTFLLILQNRNSPVKSIGYDAGLFKTQSCNDPATILQVWTQMK